MHAGKTAFTTAIQGAAKWQVVLVCGVLAVAFMVFFASADGAAPEGTPGIVDLELAFSEERFSAIVHQWAVAGTLPLQERNLWIDFLFPCAYAVLLSSLLAWVANGLYEHWPRGFVILLALPLVAGLLDWVENVLLLILLRDTSSFSAPMILAASTVSLVKWLLLVVSALVTVYYVLRRLGRFVRQSSDRDETLV